MSAKRTSCQNCDNCPDMILRLCRDRLMHRFCSITHLIIPDGVLYAVCPKHPSLALKGGVQ